MIDPKNLNTANDAPAEPVPLFHYSELNLEGRLAALDSYRDAHGAATIVGLIEGDVVDHMDRLGELWNPDGTLA